MRKADPPGHAATWRRRGRAVVIAVWLGSMAMAQSAVEPPQLEGADEPPALKLDYDPPAPAPFLNGIGPVWTRLPESPAMVPSTDSHPTANSKAPARVTIDEPSENKTASPAAGKSGTFRVGTVSFNEAAESLNAVNSDSPKPNDLSRQFTLATSAPAAGSAVPMSGWMFIALAGFAVILGLWIGHLESERPKRLHQHRHRKHRRSGAANET